MAKNIGKNISQNFKGKYSQSTQSATNVLKTTSKGAIQKTAEATGDLTGEKIADKITNFLRTLPQNNAEIVKNEDCEEILKERYIIIQLLMIQDQCNNIIMGQPRIISLLDITSNQPIKFKTKNWVEINDDSRGT